MKIGVNMELDQKTTEWVNTMIEWGDFQAVMRLLDQLACNCVNEIRKSEKELQNLKDLVVDIPLGTQIGRKQAFEEMLNFLMNIKINLKPIEEKTDV